MTRGEHLIVGGQHNMTGELIKVLGYAKLAGNQLVYGVGRRRPVRLQYDLLWPGG